MVSLPPSTAHLTGVVLRLILRIAGRDCHIQGVVIRLIIIVPEQLPLARSWSLIFLESVHAFVVRFAEVSEAAPALAGRRAA
jgi:hypothetical protein